MNSTNGLQGTGCGVTTLIGVAWKSPEATLRKFLVLDPPKVDRFDPQLKKYVACPNTRHYIHVIFGGPDMSTLEPGKSHYSAVGGCDAFAAFLRENNLGPVVESPPRHNPYHPERKEGEGDVIVYIWSPDQAALAEWAAQHPPKEQGGTR